MLHDNYLERMSQQANALKESMKHADSAYWKCDPRIHEEGKTYTEVTKVLQVIISLEAKYSINVLNQLSVIDVLLIKYFRDF